MSASYPAAVKTFTTKTNKVDLVDASHINDIQNEVNAIETELGNDPAGSATTLVARLAKALADNGAIQQGTSFPVSNLVDGQVFYRTDANVLYVYNGSTWDSQGQSLSNVVFCFGVGGDYTVDSYGMILNDSITTAATGIQKLYWAVTGSTYRAIIKTKFKKIAGISTVTFYVRTWTDSTTGGDDIAYCQVDIGGQTGTAGSSETTTPAWQTAATIDVSGLSDGTVYDVTISLKNNNTNMSYMDSIIAFGS